MLMRTKAFNRSDNLAFYLVQLNEKVKGKGRGLMRRIVFNN